jgi:hypothetical protein
MATPNYSYEKRQKELAKKQKKEDKQRRKNAPENTPDEASQPLESGQPKPGS